MLAARPGVGLHILPEVPYFSLEVRHTCPRGSFKTYGFEVLVAARLPVALMNVAAAAFFLLGSATGLTTQDELINSHDNVPRKHRTKKAVMDLRT